MRVVVTVDANCYCILAAATATGTVAKIEAQLLHDSSSSSSAAATTFDNPLKN
jgi:hypothetical protein